MENLPWYLPALFIVCTLYTFILLVLASNKKRNVMIISLVWIGLQSIVSYSLFYTDTTTILAKKTITLADAPYPWKVDKWTDDVDVEIAAFPTFGDFKDMASPPQDLETIKSTYYILVKKEEDV